MGFKHKFRNISQSVAKNYLNMIQYFQSRFERKEKEGTGNTVGVLKIKKKEKQRDFKRVFKL